MRLYWLFAALLFTLALSLIQQWALGEFLFWRYVWFDVPMHYLGGLALSVFTIGLLHRLKPWSFLLLVFILLAAWELFEYSFGIPQQDTNYEFDTALDVLMGALGALTAYVAARLTLWRSA